MNKPVLKIEVFSGADIEEAASKANDFFSKSTALCV